MEKLDAACMVIIALGETVKTLDKLTNKELLGREVDVITVGGLMPFARESADRDKILIYERAA
jgi:hypothetical protein